MSYLRSNIVGQAKTWLGRKESDGSHKEIIDVYNGHKPLARGYKVKYTDAWCATFVSACAVKCGYTAIIPTECSCPKMIDLFKKNGDWIEKDDYVPKPGDILFYDWEDNGVGDNTGRANHVGIVERVDGNNVVIIEGNYNNSVKRRTIAVNGQYIRGYGVPKYDKEPEPVKNPTIGSPKDYFDNATRRQKVQAKKPAQSKQDNLAGTYRTTANLNMRHGAGTNHKVMAVLPKNATVKNYGFYTEADGVKWLYVKFRHNKTEYVGFCSSKYLKKSS